MASTVSEERNEFEFPAQTVIFNITFKTITTIVIFPLWFDGTHFSGLKKIPNHWYYLGNEWSVQLGIIRKLEKFWFLMRYIITLLFFISNCPLVLSFLINCRCPSFDCHVCTLDLLWTLFTFIMATVLQKICTCTTAIANVASNHQKTLIK